MIVISTRDFRANQTTYLDIARRCEDVIIKSRASGSFRLNPVDTEDAVVRKRDLPAELRLALHQVKDPLEGNIQLQSADPFIV